MSLLTCQVEDAPDLLGFQLVEDNFTLSPSLCQVFQLVGRVVLCDPLGG